MTVQYANETKKPFTSPTTKVVCVGRNYIAHAKELNNPVPRSPLLFIKSTNCLVDLKNEIAIPSDFGECHHELEVAILIGKKLTDVDEIQSISAISAIGIGLDLTLRDLQTKLKSKGQPWEKAKSFDGACPLSEFIDFELFSSKGLNSYATEASDTNDALKNIDFKLLINDSVRQKGNTKDVIFDIPFLISHISKHFTLYPGDVVLTGTPEGVGELKLGDKIEVFLNDSELASAKIVND
ncbi:MAG: isomerase/hydrolase [Gammaproteobacteria bacterium]|nr:MAG: isomerase/hydrolase [Gammaproteobacteria bacterium]